MNDSHNPSRKTGMSEVDDLTRFLDEDFATDAVDLFEFTSEEDSPLVHLKSIILSLDWEITHEILQDLNDEIDHLKRLDQFEHDKVSQVYLQGLDKIGKYIQREGASAHPNSIKLLLTLYYDFEKILSSEHISGAEITALLKADVRKFKILQYQIAQRHGETAVATEEVSTPLPLTEHKDLQGIQAAILELDWEVTDKGLKNLANQLNVLKTRYANDRYIQVVIQGLHSLNAYIMEEKGRAHPETFTLLHNFYDALEKMVEKEDLDEEKRQEILIDCVNRLNNLKNLIAQTYPTEELAPEAIIPVTESAGLPEDELTLEAEPPSAREELLGEGITEIPETEKPLREEVFPEPSVEAEQPAGATAPGTETQEEFAEALFEDAGLEIAPALADSPEEGGFGGSGDLEAPPEELEEKLDFFFGGEKEEFTPEAIEEAVEARKIEEKSVDRSVAEAPEEEIAPALAGSVKEQELDSGETELASPADELEEKLASFFGEEEAPAAETGAPVGTVEEEEPPVAAFAEEDEDEQPFAFETEQDIVPALADSEEDTGFAAEAETESPSDELTDRLESFFGKEETPAAAAELPEASAAFEKEEEEEIAPALTGSEEETGFAAAAGENVSSEEFEKKLDLFFGAEERAAAAGPADETAAEEEVLLTPALEETGGEKISVFDEQAQARAPGSGAEMMSPEAYQAAVEQMQSAFREIENSLRLEISSLKKEVESLRTRLNA